MARGDYTGQQKSALAEEVRKQQVAAAQRMAMVDAQAQDVRENEVIDLMDLQPVRVAPQEPRTEVVDGEEILVDSEVSDPLQEGRVFRASEDAENVTLGKDFHVNLAAGQQYRLQKWAVEHLDQQGLVWHY